MITQQILSSLLITLCICFAVFHPVYTGDAPYSFCGDNDRPVKAKDIKINVEKCDKSTDSRCFLKIGSTYNFTINFLPEINIEKGGMERYLSAKFPGAPGEKSIEIPYGPAELANNNTFRSDNWASVESSSNKVASGVNYIHTSLFPVPTVAPKTNLTVRFLLRERITGLGRRRLTWKTHPGQLLTCLEIPVELVE